MLGIDEGGHAPRLLRFRDHVQGEGRLAGGFRTVDLGYAPARDAAHPKREVQRQRAGRDHRHLPALGDVLAEAHDRALAECLCDVADC